jgi:hypothetical protein
MIGCKLQTFCFLIAPKQQHEWKKHAAKKKKKKKGAVITKVSRTPKQTTKATYEPPEWSEK